MPAYKDETRNNWYCAFYFEDWNGERKKKMKRGFETKKAAQDWERQFLLQRAADTDMRFDKFVEQYIVDRKDRLRENTWLTKEHIINTKILPYFKDRKLSEIQARDVIAWQNELMSAKDDRGKIAVDVRHSQRQRRIVQRVGQGFRQLDLWRTRAGFVLRHANVGGLFREANQRPQVLLRHPP